MTKQGRRGSRSGRKRATTAAPTPVVAPRTYAHPLFGAIPLLVRTWVCADGDEHSGYEFDPDYRPPLPPDAVRGDPHRQCSRGAFDVPRYFYTDQERRCVQCRETFVFGAREQKHWYEALGFNFASVAVRCVDCRRRQRSDKALHQAVADAKQLLTLTPEDSAVQLALAEAIIELRARCERGRLDEAIAAARKARHLLAQEAPWLRAVTHYWEGRAHALAGRSAKARATLEAFTAAASSRRHRKQLRWAQAWLDDAQD